MKGNPRGCIVEVSDFVYRTWLGMKIYWERWQDKVTEFILHL
jgi:hypothetical protein